MATFHLQIVTPDRLCFDGEAERVIARAYLGDVCIMAHHIDYATALGIGEAKVTDAEGNTRIAACAGGMLTVSNGNVALLPTTFEWKDEIDVHRAELARDTAEERMKGLDIEDKNYRLAAAKLKRALTRMQVGH